MSAIAENGFPKREYQSISASEISSSELSKFLTYNGLKFGDNPSYLDIFSTLRRFVKEEQQEDLLVRFYTKGVKDFPNAEKFAKELVKINNIDYFKPKEEPDHSFLQELANQHLANLDLKETRIKIIRDDWFLTEDVGVDAICDAKFNARCIAVQSAVGSEAAEDAWNTAWERERAQQDKARYVPSPHAGWKTALGVIWDVILDKTQDRAIEEAVGNAVWEAIADAAWIIAEDKMPEKGYVRGNPFLPLITIYEVGCWPIGLVKNADGQEEFVIFIPPIQKVATS